MLSPPFVSGSFSLAKAAVCVPAAVGICARCVAFLTNNSLHLRGKGETTATPGRRRHPGPLRPGPAVPRCRPARRLGRASLSIPPRRPGASRHLAHRPTPFSSVTGPPSHGRAAPACAGGRAEEGASCRKRPPRGPEGAIARGRGLAGGGRSAPAWDTRLIERCWLGVNLGMN